MRNIYDIISEQKILADMKISVYETYYFMGEFNIVEEGFADSLKNAAKKVIEFIKTIIRKIKDLFQKMFGFFKTRDQKVQELDKKIEEANKKLKEEYLAKEKSREEHNNKIREKMEQDRKKQYEEEKQKIEKRHKEMDEMVKKIEQDKKENGTMDEKYSFSIKVHDLEEIIKEYGGPNGSRKIMTYKYGPLKLRLKFLDDLKKAVVLVGREQMTTDIIRNNNSRYKRKRLYNELFGGDIEIKDVPDEIAHKIFDNEKEQQQLNLLRCSDVIVDYCRQGRKVINIFENTQNILVDELEDVIKELDKLAQQNATKEGTTPQDYEKLSSMYSSLSTAVYSIFTHLIQSTTRGYNTYTTIAIKATDAYCRYIESLTGRKYGE